MGSVFKDRTQPNPSSDCVKTPTDGAALASQPADQRTKSVRGGSTPLAQRRAPNGQVSEVGDTVVLLTKG